MALVPYENMRTKPTVSISPPAIGIIHICENHEMEITLHIKHVYLQS